MEKWLKALLAVVFLVLGLWVLTGYWWRIAADVIGVLFILSMFSGGKRRAPARRRPRPQARRKKAKKKAKKKKKR